MKDGTRAGVCPSSSCSVQERDQCWHPRLAWGASKAWCPTASRSPGNSPPSSCLFLLSSRSPRNASISLPCLFLLEEVGLLEDYVTEVLTWKKCTMWKLWVKFYLGQDEDFSPGDSISDNSEKLLQRDSGEGQYICDFGEGGRVHAIKHIFFFFFQKVSAGLKEQASSWKILVLF